MPTGKLPFDLLSDMITVMSQAADVPFDMDDPLFKFGLVQLITGHDRNLFSGVIG
jgi:hypothetical protein